MHADETGPAPCARAGTTFAESPAALLLVGFCTVVFVLNAAGILTTLLTDRFAGQRDFITYWCSAREAVMGRNPYDETAIGRLERSAGYPPSVRPLIMRNAPYSLPLVYPLGFFRLKWASLLWSAMMLIAAWLSVQLLGATYGCLGSRINLLAYAFAPLLSCFIAGQTSVLALLGLSLFLRFHAERPVLAGISLWLCALKPQNFVVYGVVLLLWCVTGRRWRVFGGVLGALGITSAIATLAVPHVWSDYVRMMSDARIQEKFIPCISTAIRVLIRPTATFLQWVPLIIGCCWAIYFFSRQRSWDWLKHGRHLLLVSVLVAPYSWFMDQTLYLAALLPVAYGNRSRPWRLGSFALLSGVFEVANLLGIPLYNSLLYPWTALVWVGWYVWASSGQSSELQCAESAHAVTSVS